VWLGHGLSQMYMTFYRFPFLQYHLKPEVALTACLISALAAMLGTVYSVIRAALLPPAEAMQTSPLRDWRLTCHPAVWSIHFFSCSSG
jgi:putative ABC transport system permease protein